MDKQNKKSLLKSLDDAFTPFNTKVKRCKSGIDTLQKLAAFDAESEALATIFSQLESTAEQAEKDLKLFIKAIAEAKKTRSVKQVQDLGTSAKNVPSTVAAKTDSDSK